MKSLKIFGVLLIFLPIILSYISKDHNKSLSRRPIVNVELEGGGFHRTLIYTLRFEGPLAGKEGCKYVMQQYLPFSVFIKAEELESLKRKKELDVLYPSYVDIENLPDDGFQVFLKGEPKSNEILKLPIHYYYQPPNEEGTPIPVDIRVPTLFISCQLSEQELLEYILRMDVNTVYCLDEKKPDIVKSPGIWNETCSYKFVDKDVVLKTSLQAKIPVVKQDYFLTLYCTTILLGWLAPLLSFLRRRYLPNLYINTDAERKDLQKKND